MRYLALCSAALLLTASTSSQSLPLLVSDNNPASDPTSSLSSSSRGTSSSKSTPPSSSLSSRSTSAQKFSSVSPSSSKSTASSKAPSNARGGGSTDNNDDSGDSNKVNITYASMPYNQTMCQDTTEVSNGATLNVTWISKGKYSNNLYVRYALDEYNNWVTVPTFPPFAGVKQGGGDDNADDPSADYLISFQQTVYAYQQGFMVTIGQLDDQKNKTVSTLNSKKIKVVDVCVPKNDTTEEATDDSAPPPSDKSGADRSTVLLSYTGQIALACVLASFLSTSILL